MRRYKLLIVLAAVLSACTITEPAGMANGSGEVVSERKIAGDYSLQRMEDFKTYYLEDSARDYESFPDPGPVGGTVIKIGWDEDIILLQRKAHFFGKVDGWMMIDIARKSISGPFSDADIRQDPRLQNIQVLPAAQAWELL